MARFSAKRQATKTPFGVAFKLTADQLSDAYAWLPAKFLPELERQINIKRAAHTAVKLNAIWPYRTGRSVRSWESGINSIPKANNPPGPRPSFSLADAERRLAGAKPGDEIVHANQARIAGSVRGAGGRFTARSSYAQGLWEGRFSSQLRGGAEKPLQAHHRAIEKSLTRQAERDAIERAL